VPRITLAGAYFCIISAFFLKSLLVTFHIDRSFGLSLILLEILLLLV